MIWWDEVNKYVFKIKMSCGEFLAFKHIFIDFTDNYLNFKDKNRNILRFLLNYFLFSIDATKETGRYGRLINHSCKTPNCVTKVSLNI